ncbi:hypothetical protein Pelo_13459 [Pelomyxa schiedti]|nr:hypothetical protein Pelo_13459 [Pelomyxa schiedti]
MAHAVDLFSLATAMFPLVALACHRVAAEFSHKSAYFALRAAAKAGSAPCLRHIVSHNGCCGGGRARDNKKECVAVLRGLCGSGHLSMAKMLVEGNCGRTPAAGNVPADSSSGIGAATDRTDGTGRTGAGICGELMQGAGCWGGLAWPTGDDDFMEDVRYSGELLRKACKGGHLDAAKWVVSRFGIREPWQFIEPLDTALMNGHLELATWMMESFNLSKLFLVPQASFIDLVGACARGKRPDLVRWYLDNFPVDEDANDSLFISVLSNKNSSVELCEWLQTRLALEHTSEYILSFIKDSNIIKWALTLFPDAVNESWLNEYCGTVGDLHLAEWFILENNIPPSAKTFIAACGSIKENLSLVKWLSYRVTLTQQNLEDALKESISNNNASIADWLEEHYHIIDVIASSHRVHVVLLHICRGLFSDKVDGLNWFLHHIETPIVDEHFLEGIVTALEECQRKALLLMTKVFYAQMQKFPELLLRVLSASLAGTLSQVKEFISDINTFTGNDVAQCLTSSRVFSSKVIKWLVSQFNLDSTHIKHNHNALLYRVLSQGKRKCAEWILDSFDISFDEFMDMISNWCTISRFHNIDLQLWKMILRKFPLLTAEIIRDKMMPIITHSPINASFTMTHTKLPIGDVTHYCETLNDTVQFSSELRFWLLDH